MIQLDLGYPAISYPDISIIRHQLSGYLYYPATILQYMSIVYIVYISNYWLYSLAQDKNKVVKYCICFIVLSNPLYMSDNLLQIE